MTEPLRMKVQLFRPNDDYAVVQRRLPHWSQVGTISFLTWRTWGSLPEQVLNRWLAQRNQCLAVHGIDSTRDDWRTKRNLLDGNLVQQIPQQLADR